MKKTQENNGDPLEVRERDGNWPPGSAMPWGQRAWLVAGRAVGKYPSAAFRMQAGIEASV